MDEKPTNQKLIMVVAAHPDDAEFTAGGTLAQWAAEGLDIRYAICTGGCRGADYLDIDEAALREMREAEQLAAAAALGVKDVIFLRHLDGELAAAGTLKRELAVLIRRWRPDRLLAWDAWRPYQLHPDHRAAGIAAVEAVLAAGNPRMFHELAAEGLQAHKVEEVYLFGTDSPDLWVDITDTFEQKVSALLCHTSQVGDGEAAAAQTDACNRNNGEHCGVAYAESYKVLHPFCDQ